MPSDLTPEQREAALRLIRQWTAAIGSGSDDADRALDALLAAGWRPEPQPAVRVKPLEWAGKDSYFRGTSPDARLYEVCEVKPGRWRCYRLGIGPGKMIGECDGLDAAKQVAQADYTTRILSALTPAHSATFAAAEARGYALGVEAATLPDGLTSAQVNDACLSYRHDYGLLDEQEARIVRIECADWFRAIRRALSPIPQEADPT